MGVSSKLNVTTGAVEETTTPREELERIMAGNESEMKILKHKYAMLQSTTEKTLQAQKEEIQRMGEQLSEQARTIQILEQQQTDGAIEHEEEKKALTSALEEMGAAVEAALQEEIDELKAQLEDEQNQKWTIVEQNVALMQELERLKHSPSKSSSRPDEATLVVEGLETVKAVETARITTSGQDDTCSTSDESNSCEEAATAAALHNKKGSHVICEATSDETEETEESDETDFDAYNNTDSGELSTIHEEVHAEEEAAEDGESSQDSSTSQTHSQTQSIPADSLPQRIKNQDLTNRWVKSETVSLRSDDNDDDEQQQEEPEQGIPTGMNPIERTSHLQLKPLLWHQRIISDNL